MTGGTLTGRQGSGPPHPKIGYDNRTGAPEALPRDFMRLVIEFPERVYGTWWYIDEKGTRGEAAGWYIWIESIGLLGVSRGRTIVWRTVDELATGLAEITRKLNVK